MEGQNTESSLDHFIAGKLRKTVLLDEIFFSSLPQFISGKDKIRFKLKNCLVEEASFVEGDANIHVYFYFRPPVDANYELVVELKDGSLSTSGGGKWGNIGELVDADEELKNWILSLYNGGIIRSSKKISVTSKDSGSRVEISLKKGEKDWKDALRLMNATPAKIAEQLFNIANRLATGISNWQGKQVDPWNPTEIAKGRPAALIPTTTVTAAASTLAQQVRQAAPSSGGSSVLNLPSVPSEGTLEPGEEQAGGVAAPAAAPPVICPMCGVENKAGSKVCFRCMNPLD